MLQVIPRLNAGGAEQTTLDIAAALAARGDVALVASEGGRMVEALRASGAHWLELPVASKNPLTILVNAARLTRLIRDRRVDIVHARSRAPAWSALIAARRTGVPLVTTYHGAYKQVGRLKAWYNSVMARGDRVIANSRFTADTVIRRCPEAAAHIVVIPRGTDLTRFDRAEVAPERIAALRQAWDLAAADRVVLLPARVSPIKGHKVLLAAVKLLADAGRADFKVAFAGDDEGRTAFVAELKAEIDHMGLADRVLFVGHCTDMPAALCLADVAVAPSLVPETFGRMAVEAQAVGCPAIVSNLGAFAETIAAPPETAPADRTGWRVKVGDPTDMAALLVAALDLTPAERAALAARGRDFVMARFALPVMVTSTLEVYDGLIADRAGLRPPNRPAAT